MANFPVVQSGEDYGLGKTSFLVDPYSGRLIVDTVVEALGK